MKLAGRIFTLLLLITAAAFVRADSLDQLSSDFWAWRAVEQPISGDDIPRLERPAAWVPDWSAASVNRYRRQLDEFRNRWKKLDDPAAPVPRQVDYRLMGSAISRVRWELDYVHGWRNNAMFYVDQT